MRREIFAKYTHFSSSFLLLVVRCTYARCLVILTGINMYMYTKLKTPYIKNIINGVTINIISILYIYIYKKKKKDKF